MGVFERVSQIKKASRKKAGFYYRQLKQYHKNKAVFEQIIDLQQQSVSYYSVLKRQSVAEHEVMALVESGDIIMVKDLIGQLGLQSQMDALSKDFFDVDYAQLADIHKLKSIEQIVDDALKVRDSIPALAIQSSIMQRLLKPHTKTCYLELQPMLRLHLPYGKIKTKESYIESRMGRGKLNPHGQHKDSWRYHPKNTVNVWIALTQANDKNGMGILPQSVEYHPQYNGDEREMTPGMKTYPSLQYVTDMQPGDGLIFRAELLHGSIINMSNQTRVAFSMRCAASEPQFHKTTQPNYIKVEDGRFDNLTALKLMAKGDFEPPSRDRVFPPLESLNSSIKPVDYDDKQITLQVDGTLRTYPRYCPHAGADLLNGELNEQGQLLCPSHRMCLSGKPCQ